MLPRVPRPFKPFSVIFAVLPLTNALWPQSCRCEALEDVRQRTARRPTAPPLSRDDRFHGQSAERCCETLFLDIVRH
ncbi:hypothetical protein BGW80DRAFT_1358783 [Lactifluus volemus]|nr:hypothetical protein BGW80DRAFT_1358783 [Lactifluus volemus]